MSSSSDAVEPVLPFVFRSGSGPGSRGEARHRPQVLEVSQVWGESLVDTRHFRPGEPVTLTHATGQRWRMLGADMGWVRGPLAWVLPTLAPLGSEVTTEWRGDFHAPEAAVGDDAVHELFRATADGWVAQLPPGWTGFVDRDGVRHPVEGREVALQHGDRLFVEAGALAFVARQVPEAAPVPRALAAPDYPLIAVGSFTGFLGLMLGLVGFLGARHAAPELVEVPDRFVQMVIEAPPEAPTPEVAPPRDTVDPGEGARAAGDEGTRGTKQGKKPSAQGAPRKGSLHDRQVAEAAGVLGALAELGAADGMFASAALGGELTEHVGGLWGPTGTQLGSNGLGGRGDGLGGGGHAEGLAGLGTQGLGTGRTGYGSDGGLGGAKESGRIRSPESEAIVLGALDRAVIDEVIKRHLATLRYCYQRELQKAPDLMGKAVVKFTIARDGSVSAARTASSSLHNEAVERCLVGRFLRMQFPEPEGGGIVVVSYPFHFAR